MRNAFYKDILRSIKKGWKRFLSILIITALGVGMLTGFYAACLDMYYSADQFFDKQNLFDIRILSTLGLTQEDVDALARVDGVEAIEGGYVKTVHTNMNGERRSADMTVLSRGNINMPLLLAGALPTKAGEIAVTSKYLDESGKSIGDIVTIEEDVDEKEDQKGAEPISDTTSSAGSPIGVVDSDIDLDLDMDTELNKEQETPTFANTAYTITGIVLDPQDIRSNNDTGNAFRSTVTADYTFFITEADAHSDGFTVVYIVLSGTKAMNSYSDAYYEDKVQSVIRDIEKRIKNQRERARYDAVLSEAQSKIAEAENTMDEKFAEADKKFADAWRDIYEARQELADGEATLIDEQKDAERKIAEAREKLENAKRELVEAEAELAEGEVKLAEAKAELMDGERELADGRTELLAGEQELAYGETQLIGAENELKDGESKLLQGEAELNKNAQELAEGRKRLEEERNTAFVQFRSAEQKLDAAQGRLDATRSQLEPGITQLKSTFEGAWPASEWNALVNAAAALAAAGADDAAIAAGTASESFALAAAIQVQAAAMKGMLLAQISHAQGALDLMKQAIDELNEQLALASQQAIRAQTALTEKQSAANAAQNTLSAQIERWNNLAEGTPEYEEQQAVIFNARRELDAANASVSDAQNVLNRANEAAAGLASARDTQSATAAELSAAIERMNIQMGQLDALPADSVVQAAIGLGMVNGGQQALDTQKSLFAEQKAEALQALAEAEAELVAGEKQIEEAQNAIESKKTELVAGKARLTGERAKLEDGKTELAVGWAEWQMGKTKLDDGWAEWEDGKAELAEGRTELEKGKSEVAHGEAKLNKEEADAKVKIAGAWDDIAEGKQELAEGETELTQKEQDYAEKKAEAQQELSDAYAKLDDIDMTRWYVQDRTSLDSYASLNSDLSSIEAIGRVFPIIFLLVAVLMSLTTMTRMVEEERGLIGAYKALGFENVDIYRKYILFAFIACVLGGILGDIFGFVFMPKFVAVILESLYSFPQYYLRFDILYGVGGSLLFMFVIIGATILACRSELTQTPAALLRPKAPRSGSRVWLERIPAIWNRLKFLNKVTVRNLFRYKKRLFMTIGGIMGCTALIICGFAIKDSVMKLPMTQYDSIYQYDLMVVFEEKDNDDMLRQLAEDGNIHDYLNLRIESVKLFNAAGESSSAQLLVIPTGSSIADYIRLENVQGAISSLDDAGVLITENATRILGLKPGGAVSLQNLELEQDEAILSGVVRNYLGNNVYMTQGLYESLFGVYEPNGVIAHLSDTCADSAAYAETLLDNDSVISAISNAALRDDFGFDLLNAIVLLLIVMAGGLAFVVLFTLSNTNISERVRELATIKVLGFYDKEVYQYVNKETLILTAMGILAGLPAGRILGGLLTAALNMPSIHFAVYIKPVSYVIAAGITFCFASIVNWITNRALDRINMVEALKSVE